MNNTEYEMLTREQLLKMVEDLQDQLEHTESQLEVQLGYEDPDGYDEGYADGLAETCNASYDEGYEAGWEAAMDEMEMHTGESL